jgi:hypothetical protein
MQELTQRQRLATFVAQHSRDLFPIAEAFAERLCQVWPGARGLFRLDNKTERFAFAMVVSDMCKNVDRLDERSYGVAMMRRRMARAGMAQGQMGMVRGAFVDTLRQHAGTTWDGQMERDWNEVMDRCLGPAASERPMRMAA